MIEKKRSRMQSSQSGQKTSDWSVESLDVWYYKVELKEHKVHCRVLLVTGLFCLAMWALAAYIWMK